MAVDYQIHLSSYIAKCINKDKPLLHCDGHCVLMTKIKDKEKDEAEKNVVVYEYSSHYVHKERVVFSMTSPHHEVDKNTISLYRNEYGFNYYSPIFRPPIA